MKTTACFRESNVSLNVVTRLLYIALALFPLLCYLEWGGTKSAFLFEAQYQVLFHPKDPGNTFTHPLMRRSLIMEDSNAPQEWNVMFGNIENNFAPWKFSPDDRDKWVEEMH